MIFQAFYRASTQPQAISLPQVVDYVWLGQAMFALLPWGVDLEVGAMIRSGTVVYELLRPLDLYSLWFSRALAARTAPTLLRAAPVFVVAGLFFGLRPPASLASAGAWLTAMLGAVLLSSAMSTMFTVCMLWTISGEGIMQLTTAGVFLLSGISVPLPLFPDWAQTVINLLPFRGLVDVPARLYSGNLPPAAAWGQLAQQLLWTLAFVAVGRYLLTRAARKLVVQGG
jgi:ABC-2 type transport system permease protein